MSTIINILHNNNKIVKRFKVEASGSTQNLELKHCPRIRSDLIIDIDQLLGDWHLALVIMDDEDESFEQRSLCIQGKIMRMNSTTLLQIVTLDIPEILQQHNTNMDFPTTIITPGIWLVQSPLGGELKGIVIEGGESTLLMMYCGWHKDIFSHIVTLALTRDKVVTPIVRLELLSSLVRNGYDPYRNKIINWSDC